jgi:alpha-L-fucosidase
MTHYRADPDSLAAHPVPAWWRDAKLGVMITWGLFSVPAYAPRGTDVVTLLRERPDDALKFTPYAEWYENSLKFADGPTARQHSQRFGDRPYADFRAAFEAGLAGWSAEPLLDLIADCGARYVVPVTKHHDSYCLWPTRFRNPLRGAGWHAPRDLVAELGRATRARGLRFGVYYSAGLDWTLNPEPIASLGAMRASLPAGETARAMMRTHYAELIEATDPDILWNDIGYPDAGDLWALLAEYYNGRDDRLVNDRFQLPTPSHAAMADPAAREAFNRGVADALKAPGFAFAPDMPPVFDHRTPEYAVSGGMGDTAWETVRGIGHSFGHNAAETPADHLSADALIAMFLKVVGNGGNLLINIGPRADGSVPPEQAEPLAALGQFLRENGAGIYGSRPDATLPSVDSGTARVMPVCVGQRRFALIAGAPGPRLELPGWGHVAGLARLSGEDVAVGRAGDALVLDVPGDPAGGSRVLEVKA